MNPWFETLFAVLIALAGVGLGRLSSRFSKPYWVLCYLVSCSLIIVMAATRFSNTLAFMPGLSWIVAGRGKFVVLSLAAAIGLTSPLSRLPYRFERKATCFVIALVVVWFAVLPFLAPCLVRKDLSSLQTRLDLDGNCYQSRAYTCAPAAAVTALKKLGLEAQEGRLAISAYTSPFTGTLPGCLEAALNEQYGPDGLQCEYRRFSSVDQLKGAGIVLAVVKDSTLTDHCVAVLEVSDDTVKISDPVMGADVISYEQFAKMWRFKGVVLNLARNI